LILSKEPLTDFKEIGQHFIVVFKRKPEEKVTENGGLSGGLKTVYDAIRKRGGIKAKYISLELGMPLRTVERNISRLEEMDKVERKGSKKTGGYYRK